jgi:pyridoxamine 5'-phosphate oxidase
MDRHEYTRGSLDESQAGTEPFALVGRWFAEAQAAGEPEPEAMCLATVDARNRPSARIVLLRAWDEQGFCFYTNYGSRKADELDIRCDAALTFFWPLLERQLRIEGKVERLDDATVSTYFATRPRESQLAAWASLQSSTLADRAELEAAFTATEARFAGVAVPVPAFWGGYRLEADRIEFWQGREHRLHDRLLFSRQAEGGWRRSRLAP